jgi:hypothetical protein
MVEADLSFEGAIVLELCPAVATCCLHLVVTFPGELDGGAFAAAMDGTGEAVQGELAMILTEQDVGAQPSHIVLGGLNNAPLALHAHVGTDSSLGRRIRL